jgi:hypothetical protein
MTTSVWTGPPSLTRELMDKSRWIMAWSCKAWSRGS